VFQVLGLITPKKLVEVKDLVIKTCGNSHEGLALQDIHVYNNREEEIVISGKVNVMTFLSAPITVRRAHCSSHPHLLRTVLCISSRASGRSEIKFWSIYSMGDNPFPKL
jgi:hypothetical protein